MGAHLVRLKVRMEDGRPPAVPALQAAEFRRESEFVCSSLLVYTKHLKLMHVLGLKRTN